MLSYELLSVLLTLACLHVDANPVTTSFNAYSNPAYDGFSVTLTCSLSGGSSAQQGDSASVDKYLIEITHQGTSTTQGNVKYDASNAITTKTGLFERASISCDWLSLSVSFIAKVTFAGNYQCQATLNPGSSQPNVLELKVYEAPSPPEIHPPLLTFNDSDPMLINCTSTNGNPPAEIELRITTNANIIMNYTATAQNSVLLRLNASIALYDATTICQVKNHLLPNMTATSNIKVNHIVLRPGVNASQNARESEVLNCSKLVDSFPPPVFAWSNLSASTFTTPASSGSFGPVGYSGILSCTATNNVLQKSVVVTFYIEKDPTTRLPVMSSSHARLQTNTSSAVTKTSISTSLSSSWAPAETSDGTTIIATTTGFLSTQGSSLLTSLTGSISSNTGSHQNIEPIIIGVTVSVSLFSAAVAVTIVILRYCRTRTPPRNLPASQSTSKIIGENQMSESQGEDAEDFVCMTDNDLYGSSPPLCSEYKSSIIYNEPYHRPSVSSTIPSTSQDKDSHSLSIRPHESDFIAQQDMDDRPAASSQCQVHAAKGEWSCSTEFDASSTPIGTDASVKNNESLSDPPASQQSFTQGKPPHNKSFDNMAYMDIQLAESNAPEDCLHKED